jgi:hypothetical protein
MAVPKGSKLPPRAIDLTGRRFGRWIVIGRSDSSPKGRAYWTCRCDCGKVKSVRAVSLLNGDSQSCRCLSAERVSQATRTHGDSHTAPEYKSWHGMRQRCNNPKSNGYARYGSRGITVCSRWDGQGGYENFLSDMGRRPSPRHSLDRIDNNGPYSPENCRWAIKKVQSNNRNVSLILTHAGESKALTDWARQLGLPVHTIRGRLRRGWTVSDSLETPYLGQGGRR